VGDDLGEKGVENETMGEAMADQLQLPIHLMQV
jgi:hypothetical protein